MTFGQVWIMEEKWKDLGWRQIIYPLWFYFFFSLGLIHTPKDCVRIKRVLNMCNSSSNRKALFKCWVLLLFQNLGYWSSLMRFFFMYEKNLFSQIFPRVNHSLWVRKFIGKSSTFCRHLGAALFSKYYWRGEGRGGGSVGKQNHLSLEVQAKVFLLQKACCDYVISGISLPLLIRLNSTITENPPGKKPLARCCSTKWGGGGIPCGGQQGGSSCAPAQSSEIHNLEGHILDPMRQVVVSAKFRYKMLSAQTGEISSHWAYLGRILRGEEIPAES